MTRIGPLIVLLVLTSCTRPNYVDQGAGDQDGLIGQDVTFQVLDAYKSSPPDCIAILPLSAPTPEQGAVVRQSLYAHLAIQSKRGVRLELVDHALAEAKGNVADAAKRLHCDAVIQGSVTDYGDRFLLVYSRVSVGVDLTMVRAADGEPLWRGRHVAVSLGGSLPLDLVGVGMSVADAVGNVTNQEQVLRLTDDVARRLVSTIPDNRVTALDEPAVIVPVPDDLAVAERLLAQGDAAGAMHMVQAVLDRGDGPDGAAWFLKGRLLLLDHDYSAAEAALIRAVALGGRRAEYMNALGVVATAKGDADRALAAYQMALDVDKSDGFAWYNSAVIHSQARRWGQSADCFYGAGLAYLKAKNYALAERCIGDLKGLSARNVPVQDKIKFLQDALNDLSRRKI